ncbi:MAG: sulfatase-like hydrolase/transferase [Bacteroidota bacterium]
MKYLLQAFFLLSFIQCSEENSDKEERHSNNFQNVLFIISDDLANHAVACYGNPIIQTPNIDRLAKMGVRFENAYANSPMCTPSRACLLTGRYPHAVGTTLLHTPLPDSTYTIAEHLKKAGFATGIFGKTHFNSGLKHGFDTLVNNHHHQSHLEQLSDLELVDTISYKVRPKWKPFRDPARIWLNADGATSGNSFENSQGTFFANATIRFIQQHQEERFLAVASFREPHSPFNFPNEYYQKYEASEINLPNASAEDKQWMPQVFRGLTTEEKEGITRAYYTSVSYMDQNVGLLLDELERLNLMDKTLIIFVGDHGYLLNHHGRFEKHMMWEEAVKTPLIIKGYEKNASREALVELADIAPTLVEALDLEAMPAQHGHSLLPLLQKTETANHREHVFSVYYTDNKAMIFDGRWKYIFTSGKADLGSGYETGNPPTGILHRLYDLENDPKERKNLAALVAYRARLESMQATILAKFRATHPSAEQISSDLSVAEQLILFCEPPERLAAK